MCKRERLAATTSAMGLSLGRITEVFALLLRPGKATLGCWVRQHARRAGQVLAALDGPTQAATVQDAVA